MINKNIELGIIVLRIPVSVLMLLHGVAKLNGVSFIGGVLSEKGLPYFLAYGVYLTEIVAPLLIIIGYRTRLASVVFIIGVLFAIFLVHSKDIFMLNRYGGWEIELLGLYLFAGIALFFTGGGKYAVSTTDKFD